MDTLGDTLITMVVLIGLVCGCWGFVVTARERRLRRRRAEEFFGAVDRRPMKRISELDQVRFDIAMAELHRDLERGEPL